MILFIHGISQQQYIGRKEELEDAWRRHLTTGLLQFKDCDPNSILDRVKLAFYADLTNPTNAPSAVQSAAASHLAAELAAEIEGQPVQAWYHSELLSATLRTIDNSSFLRSTVGAALLRAVSEEATIYLDNKGVRRNVHDRVLETCNGQTQLDLIVGHSLGSVIAFDLIASGALSARGLLTLGSPLGSAAFRRRLAKCPADLRERIGAWRDIRDPLDLVAFQKIDIDKVSKTHLVDNPKFTIDEVDNPTENKHSIGGYLPLRVTASRILEILRENNSA